MYKIITYYEEDPEAIENFRNLSERVWNDHVFYTRNTILSILSDSEDLDDVVDRLMRNQDDIGALMLPHYRQSDVEKFVDLLKKHISIAGELVKAAKNDEELLPWQSAWKENGDAIVSCLSSLNPAVWSRSTIAPLWGQHMNLTVRSVMSRLNKDWNNDIVACDANFDCITELADIFANGIIAHNIEGFSK